MKQKRYTKNQIIRILQVHETGAKAPDLIREHGMSEQGFYRWRDHYNYGRPHSSLNCMPPVIYENQAA